MQRHLITGLVAGLLMASVTIWAPSALGLFAASQTPSVPRPSTSSAPPTPTAAPTPTTPRVAAAEGARPVTVEGCVVREEDVPGRKPNAVERAGIDEDFILAEAKVVTGARPAASRQPMFEIEGIDHETLKSHAGKRVQLQGAFGSVDSGLVEIRATSIKVVTGECPVKSR